MRLINGHLSYLFRDKEKRIICKKIYDFYKGEPEKIFLFINWYKGSNKHRKEFYVSRDINIFLTLIGIYENKSVKQLMYEYKKPDCRIHNCFWHTFKRYMIFNPSIESSE